MSTDPGLDLELLIRSRYGLIHVDTLEEERVAKLLRHVSDRLTLPLFTWSRSRGLRRDGYENAVYDTQEPAQALAHIAASRTASLYHFAGGAALLREAALTDRFKEIAAELGQRHGALVLCGTELDAPPALERILAVVRLPEPDAADFRALLQHLVRDLRRRGPAQVELTPGDETRLLASLRGLTLLEAEKLLTRAIVDDGRLTADDVERIAAARRARVERAGVLEYYPAEESLAEVADLAGLKAWLARRRSIIAHPEQAADFGLTFPRGVLLIGVPGCGKSLCARAVAADWGLPLLKLDTGTLYNKYIGETEKNFRRAMQSAEKLAPCVLFIDELEKAFASDGSADGGVSQRVLGSFLGWMQERKGDVFTVATANDVSRLPPEFLRKGRFDEIFFVDLPDEAARRQILEIHLRRRRQEPDRFDLAAIAAAAPQFSGAELEQAVVAALYTAFSAREPLTTASILAEIAATRPLSTVMAEKIGALRAWAHGRTVAAN
ncbi:MAG TPA: AAA family ATPase [Longimicrobiales bacterium]|nr:AAA family ATPase [Longimicrobiales bacterium]